MKEVRDNEFEQAAVISQEIVRQVDKESNYRILTGFLLNLLLL